MSDAVRRDPAPPPPGEGRSGHGPVGPTGEPSGDGEQLLAADDSEDEAGSSEAED